MFTPLDPARALHSVDEPRQRDRLDLEALGESGLRHPFAARQMHDGPPLRLGQVQRLEAPVHVAAQQPRNVGYQETERPVGEKGSGHMVVSGKIVSMLMISLVSGT